MKTFKFIFIFLLLTQSIWAQEKKINDSPMATIQNMEELNPSDSIEFNADNSYQERHIIKMNLPSLAVSTFSFQYEFFPVSFMSLNLSYKFTTNRKILFESAIIKLIEDNNDVDGLNEAGKLFFEDFRFKGNSFTPEIRFYLGKGYGKGFYLGPMIRFDNYKFTTNYPFKAFNEEYDISFDGTFNSFGYGLSLGLQYTIGKHFVIDTFIAPYLSNIKIDFKSTSQYSLTPEEIELFQQELEQFQLPNGVTNIQLSSSSAKVNMTSKSFPNLRAGLAIGFRF